KFHALSATKPLFAAGAALVADQPGHDAGAAQLFAARRLEFRALRAAPGGGALLLRHLLDLPALAADGNRDQPRRWAGGDADDGTRAGPPGHRAVPATGCGLGASAFPGKPVAGGRAGRVVQYPRHPRPDLVGAGAVLEYHDLARFHLSRAVQPQPM